jgi:ribosomal protein S12 methylthiotransferase accessory factor
VVPDRSEVPRGPENYARETRGDLLQDVKAAEKLVRDRGMELLVLDQTRPDVGLPVVRVIVPGLRHFWARFAPGRLFDTPVELGRLSRATAYGDLNPIPLFV